MENKGFSYKDAGVDIDAGSRSVEMIRPAVESTYRREVLSGLGGFGGFFALDTGKYRNPVLVSGTDGVGTKLKVAFGMGRHDTIGVDAVAMCVNDILVSGAEPLFFLDYLAVGRLEPEQAAAIVSGIAEGCRQAGCALIGGETAEMPGFYPPGEYDVAGFAVGAVEREKIIDGSSVKEGDALIGLPSSGLHSNGFSLARKVLLDSGKFRMDDYSERLGRTVGEELLEPTRIYVKTVLSVLEKHEVNGMAHITGGGLVENVPRIIPEGLEAVIDYSAWEAPAVFGLIRETGGIDEEEMHRVFNMGIGFVFVVPADKCGEITAELESMGEKPVLIGKTEKRQEP